MNENCVIRNGSVDYAKNVKSYRSAFFNLQNVKSDG